MQNQPIKLDIHFIKEPEDIFQYDNLTHKSGEIQIIINRFDLAENMRDVHRWVIDLLNATANFRYASVPSGMFYELRHKNKSDLDLKKLFTSLGNAISATKEKLTRSNVDEADKKILRMGLDYCKKSILDRIQSLRTDDRLRPLWEESELKKMLD